MPGDGLKAKSANGYVVLEELGIDIADSAGANVVDSYSSVINAPLENKKVVVYLEVTEVCAGDGALDLSVDASHDQLSWVEVDTDIIDDVDPTGLNSKSGLLDLTNIFAPYYRLHIHTDGTDILDAAEVKVAISYKEVFEHRS